VARYSRGYLPYWDYVAYAMLAVGYFSNWFIDRGLERLAYAILAAGALYAIAWGVWETVRNRRAQRVVESAQCPPSPRKAEAGDVRIPQAVLQHDDTSAGSDADDDQARERRQG
jgi:hypothetical protein